MWRTLDLHDFPCPIWYEQPYGVMCGLQFPLNPVVSNQVAVIYAAKTTMVLIMATRCYLALAPPS
jgi:hypothetical protein